MIQNISTWLAESQGGGIKPQPATDPPAPVRPFLLVPAHRTLALAIAWSLQRLLDGIGLLSHRAGVGRRAGPVTTNVWQPGEMAVQCSVTIKIRGGRAG